MPHTAASDATPAQGGDAEESGVIYADRKKPEGWYVSVSDIPIDDVQAWEDGGVEYHEAGAVYIGELTHVQYTVFQKEFSKAYKGQYVVSYRCKMQLSKEDELALRMWLGNYDYLSDEQREVLDIAVRVANQVRAADGCKGKNVPLPQNTRKKKKRQDSPEKNRQPGVSKYEYVVQSIIEDNISKVVKGEAKPLLQKDIVSKIKKEWKDFENLELDSIRKGVGKTLAWKNSKQALNEAWRSEGLGESYYNRQKGDKRHNKSPMDIYRDVNNN